MKSLQTTEDQIKEFTSLPDEKPLVMINLLKFKEI